MAAAVEASSLRKAYGTHLVLDDVDLTIDAGTVQALLGPNGAGKTTTVDILTTRTAPDGGRAEILGLDVVRDRDAVRRHIAVARQDATVDLFLTGRENLQIGARLLGWTSRAARSRSDRLLERLDLTDAADRRVAAYSGGMRRRLDLAMCLLGDPQVLFLDEPTTGLDPTSRQELWTIVRELVETGTTVVLTTQYLDEADSLADTVVLVNDGRVVARGTPAQLKRTIGHSDRIEATVGTVDDLERAARVLAAAGLRDLTTDRAQCRLSARTDDDLDGLLQTAARLRDAGVEVVHLALRQPSLDEVFTAFTQPAASRSAG